MDCIIMGVKIGKADSWNQFNEQGIQFEQFVPEEKFNHVFECDIFAIDFETGIVSMYPAPDEDNEEQPEAKEITAKKVLELLLAGS